MAQTKVNVKALCPGCQSTNTFTAGFRFTLDKGIYRQHYGCRDCRKHFCQDLNYAGDLLRNRYAAVTKAVS